MEKIKTDKDSMNTKRVTNSSVKVFRNYLKEKGLREDFENCTNDELDGMLTQLYAEARTQNGKKYQKSSLNAIRYGINRHVGKDIMNDVVFKKSREMYVAVTKELKREGKGGINHYPPIEDDDLVKMYAYFDTNDSVKLQQKVFVDVMLYFGRRGRENLALLNITDFAATTDANGDLYDYITKDEQTKNHQDDPNSADGRMYAKKGDDMCPVKSFLKYKKYLNPKCSRLFQRPGKSDMTWYDNCPVGHNRISNMMVTISE